MSADIYTQEKAPLLPYNSEEECQRLECYKNKLYKRKYKQQTILVVIFIILYSFYNAYHEDMFNYVRDKEEILRRDNYSTFESLQGLSTFGTVSAFGFEDKVDANGYCNGKPDIPYTGPSKFEIDANLFHRLSISQKTKTYHGQSISLVGGNTVVFEDKNVSQATVEFTLKFNREELQDVYWIEEIKHNEEGLYELILKNNDQQTNGCVIIDIVVRLPTATAINDFALSLSSSRIDLKKGLIFQKLAVAVANGSIQFSEGITSVKTGFSVANGHISGTIDTLSDELHANVANGNIEVVINEIDTTIDIPIDFKVVNGHIDLQVPTSFKSVFGLSSRIGKVAVESSIPQNIHSQTYRRGTFTGYYGDDSQTKSSIALAVTIGSVHLNYA